MLYMMYIDLKELGQTNGSKYPFWL